MIIDKPPLPDDPMPTEAPPSYDTVGANTSNDDGEYFSGKKPQLQQPIAGPSSSPLTPTSPYSGLKSPALSEPSSASAKGKGRAVNWLKFAQSPQERKQREIRTTILDLIRDVIQEHLSNSEAAVGILQSCADVCASHAISFSTLLQEKSIENRTPLYWAIVKRLPDEHQDVEGHQGADLLSALLSHASPLGRETVAELRLACLATSDQKLFQRLRQSPGFAPISGVNKVLLGMELLPDEITVEELPGDDGKFAAQFVIPHFIKRMTVAKGIELEFIARGRMWSLVFFVAPERRNDQLNTYQPVPGSWCIRLGLLDSSPPTYIDSLLTILPTAKPISQAQAPPQTKSPPTVPNRLGIRLHSSEGPKKNEEQTLSIRLQSRNQLQASRNSDHLSRSIVHALSTSASGANLQYSNNQYIGPDEKLHAHFEASLDQPKDDTDCVIC